MLGEIGIDLLSLKVYETQGSRTFEADLTLALSQANKAFYRWWIVHFAPSAAEFVTPVLRNHFTFNTPDLLMGASTSIRPAKVAAIGSVTSAFIQDELRIHVDIAPPKPTPQDLVRAIITHDRDSKLP
ncbi:hypothetical protein H0H93_015132 [Arthromyces matolae]|nr:hypothetical protein H0H93_015132 [Arthromyces matolae]